MHVSYSDYGFLRLRWLTRLQLSVLSSILLPKNWTAQCRLRVRCLSAALPLDKINMLASSGDDVYLKGY